jgi:hypothetical protein
MTAGHGNTRRPRRLLVIAAVCVLAAVVLVGPEPRLAQDVARDRCQDDVRKQLASPKGVEPSRITVWNASGMINAEAQVGGTIHHPFTCRAYFVDGNLADTLVLFDHAH